MKTAKAAELGIHVSDFERYLASAQAPMIGQQYSAFIPGKPEPQGSTKAFVVGGRARVTSDNTNLMPWRALAVTKLQEMARDWPLPLFSGAVYVQVEFVFPRLKSHPKTAKGAQPEHTVKPDIDKLLRALYDAMTVTGVVRDDACITKGWQSKRYAKIGEAAGTLVTIRSADYDV